MVFIIITLFLFPDFNSLIDPIIRDIAEASVLKRFCVLFAISAAPIVEIVMVIPLSISLGFNPLVVLTASVTGNLFAIYTIAYLYPRAENLVTELVNGSITKDLSEYIDVYGLIIICLICPLSIGSRIGTVSMMAIGINHRDVLKYMSLSILAIGIILVVFSYSISLISF